MKTRCIVLFLLAISLHAGINTKVFADDAATGNAPFDAKDSAALPSAISPIGLFQKFISPADGDRCPMYPTCSHYAQQAFSRKGLLMGWILTCDRLLRCGHDETHIAPAIRIDGVNYTYDPLDANTFWWRRR